MAATALGAADDLHELTESACRFQRSITPGSGEVEAVDVTDTVRRVVVSARTEYPATTLRWELPETAVARAPRTLAFALEELVDHAVTHPDADPTVEVTVREREDHVAIRVVATGPGIPGDIREVLERGEETQLEHTVGLRLWLVRWSVINAGGSISIEDNEPRGAVVVLRLPVVEDSDGDA